VSLTIYRERTEVDVIAESLVLSRGRMRLFVQQTLGDGVWQKSAAAPAIWNHPGSGCGDVKPLNGEKTHPLTAHAVEALRSLERTSRPRQDINPGVVNRLLREQLIELVDRPDPSLNRRRVHARITDAGRARLRQMGC
jgi:hypothetical protein